MTAWMLLALAWLAGVAGQTQQAQLWASSAYGWGMLGCGALAGAACLAKASWQRARQAPSLALKPALLPAPLLALLLALFLAMLAVAGLAWTSTGWRAAARMAEQVPDAWRGQIVPVIVQVEGLPRASAGDAVFDARVLR